MVPGALAGGGEPFIGGGHAAGGRVDEVAANRRVSFPGLLAMTCPVMF